MNKKEFLNDNIERINKAVAEYLGVDVNFQIEESGNYLGETIYKLVDETNIKDSCGIMSLVFKKVNVLSWSIYYGENNAIIDIHLYYEYIKGGYNGSELCTVLVKDGMAKIK